MNTTRATDNPMLSIFSLHAVVGDLRKRTTIIDSFDHAETPTAKVAFL